MTHLPATVLAIYRVLNPCRTTDRGWVEDFRRELREKGGLDVNASTVHRWLKGTQTPDDETLARVWKVVAILHKQAHRKVTAELRAVERIRSRP